MELLGWGYGDTAELLSKIGHFAFFLAWEWEFPVSKSLWSMACVRSLHVYKSDECEMISHRLNFTFSWLIMRLSMVFI